ncbi:HAMP domain-containing sensor histidine kinase [Phormidium sp. CCY1219]|uniref:HAMP domain-containing sensor histidine kinase n=1 Tax=Phormidium sp. CCY1219 TaxID=2886104 RepID=UPI002D1F91F6|nr:ATP-binding protein [Phormidium sp. CCY1219]MEB3830263.1 HAMP domain-containing histidine kinase [Phormidium sp. CCY1219]
MKNSKDYHYSSTLGKEKLQNWIMGFGGRCNIRQKISLGYLLSLGVALVGTTIAVAIGSYYQEQALQRFALASDRQALLTSLRIATLEVPFYRQELNDVSQMSPAEFQAEKNQWLESVASVRGQLWELKEYPEKIVGLEPLLQEYKGVVEAYTRELDLLLEEIAPLTLEPEEITNAKQVLLGFSDRPAVERFNRFSQQLQTLMASAQEEQQQAKLALWQAGKIRRWFIGVTMLVSVGSAILLALYISWAIARPIQAVTAVSQQVAKESNFNLKAPIQTQDEIGVLASSFNELIAQVNHLISELENEKESQLIQSEKMASLGRMLAGVAHEINNPINFIYGNLPPAEEYLEDIFDLLDTYETEIPEPPPAVKERAEEIEIEFIKEDLFKILQSMKVGAQRARAIALSLKNFSRLDENIPQPVDLHECIDSSLLILHNRIKKSIQVIRNYGNLPPIEAYMGLLYQVFMNLLSNAVDALDEQTLIQGVKGKEITISTEQIDERWVNVRIADNGPGISPENQEKIFAQFFTTKPRGVGTGLGLAISRQIVEDKHGGKIIVCSEVGMGTEFSITLPIKAAVSL